MQIRHGGEEVIYRESILSIIKSLLDRMSYNYIYIFKAHRNPFLLKKKFALLVAIYTYIFFSKIDIFEKKKLTVTYEFFSRNRFLQVSNV